MEAFHLPGWTGRAGLVEEEVMDQNDAVMSLLVIIWVVVVFLSGYPEYPQLNRSSCFIILKLLLLPFVVVVVVVVLIPFCPNLIFPLDALNSTALLPSPSLPPQNLPSLTYLASTTTLHYTTLLFILTLTLFLLLSSCYSH